MSIYMKYEFRVEDFATWKEVYEGRDEARSEAGCIGSRVLRNLDDSNAVLVMQEWAHRNDAEVYASSPGVKVALSKSGIIGTSQPSFFGFAN